MSALQDALNPIVPLETDVPDDAAKLTDPPEEPSRIDRTIRALFEEPKVRTDGRLLSTAARSMGVALVGAAIYGAACGTSSVSQSLWDLVAVPMVVLLAAAGTMPVIAGVARGRGIAGLTSALAAGHLAALAIMGACAPVIALYTCSSQSGGLIAVGVACVAVPVGMFTGARRAKWSPPILAGILVYALLLFQLISLAGPILPETTLFDGGIDGLLSR